MTAAAVVVLVAGCGVFAGMAIDQWSVRRRGKPWITFVEQTRRPGGGLGREERRSGGQEIRRGGTPRRSPEEERGRFLDRLTDELSLTPVQRARIDTIVRRQGEQFNAIMHEMNPRMDSVFRSARQAIDSVLDADQRKKYAEIRSRRRGGPGFPGGGMAPGPRAGGPPR
jgi:hypothetical protein